MNGFKHVYTPELKNCLEEKYGKLNDILRNEGKLLHVDLANIPIIKQCDNAKLLPKYTRILAKLEDTGISLSDLDLLQLDLEKLLSTSASRIRYLLLEIGAIRRNGETYARKPAEEASLKRKLPAEKLKLNGIKNDIRHKRNCNILVNKFSSSPHLQQDAPKVSLPKNDSSDKFWTSIDPFCSNITKDDLVFLDSLIQEYSKEIEIRIPDVGEHYANMWTDDVLNEECNLGKSPSKKSFHFLDLNKSDIIRMSEDMSIYKPQSSLGIGIEEKIINAISKQGDINATMVNLKSSDTGNSKEFTPKKLGVCFEKLLKKKLKDRGFLNIEVKSNDFLNDEILKELNKCKAELLTLNTCNINELEKLKVIACNELTLNERKEQLQHIDKQTLELYNNIMFLRKAAQQENGELDTNIFTKLIYRDFESKADALLKQQLQLDREINKITEGQILY